MCICVCLCVSLLATCDVSSDKFFLLKSICSFCGISGWLGNLRTSVVLWREIPSGQL